MWGHDAHCPSQPTGSQSRSTLTLTSGPYAFKVSNEFKQIRNSSKHDLIKVDISELKKSQIKYWGIWFEIKNNFHYWSISQIFTDFKLKFRFLFHFEFPRDWSLREFMLTSINSSMLNLGHGVLQNGLQIFLFDLVDMHRLSLIMEDDIEFQRGLIVKQFLENFGEKTEIF
jgi:hypothetical protein